VEYVNNGSRIHATQVNTRPRLNPSQTGRYLIYSTYPGGMEG